MSPRVEIMCDIPFIFIYSTCLLSSHTCLHNYLNDNLLHTIVLGEEKTHMTHDQRKVSMTVLYIHDIILNVRWQREPV